MFSSPGGENRDFAQCGTTPADWCDGVCLECQLFPPGTAGTYHLTYTANISVNMAQYGGANSLDFTWSYRPLYTGSKIQAGSTYPIRSQVNDIRYDDSMVAIDYNQFYNGGHSWESSPSISHSDTVAVTRGSDSNTGYIGLVIYYEPVVATPTENINHFTKGISFKITTPVQNSAAMSSSNSAVATTSSRAQSSSSSSSSGISTSSQSTTLSSLPLVSGVPSVPQSGDPPSTNSPDLAFQSSQSPSSSTATKVGAAIGSIALVALFVIAFLLYRSRKKKAAIVRLEEQEATPVAYPPEKQENSPFSATMPLGDVPFSTTATPILSASTSDLIPSSNPVTSRYSTTRTSYESTRAHEAPPLYGAPIQSDGHYDVPPTSRALAAFADANRDLISEDLELRLSVAGYLPSDDPDNLTEEEWMTVHNVTKLELIRLRSLFAARRRQIEAAQSNAGESH